MLRQRLLLALGLVACSQGDGSRPAPIHPEAGMPEPARDAGVVSPVVSPAPAPTTVGSPFPPELLRPQAQDAAHQQADTALAAGDAKGALALYQQLATTGAEPDRARARLLSAVAAGELGQWRTAADGFAASRAEFPVLVDWLSYQEARARYFSKDLARARSLATAVPADAIIGADAELLLGDLDRAAGDPRATAARYRSYLQARPKGIRRSEARFRLAEAAVSDAPDEAIAAWRAITIEDPLSSWASKADAKLTEIRARATVAPLTAAEHITRGTALFDAMRNPEGEAEFALALADPTVSPADACTAAYHQGQSRFKARDRKAAAPMFDDAMRRCKLAGNVDLEIKAAYQAGRAYAFEKQHETAIARYRSAQTIDASHSYADDALLREAEEWADLKQDAEVRRALGELPKAFPAGDMKAEAHWRLGWRAWRAGNVDEAIGFWQAQIQGTPIDDNYWAEGQPQYWLGRAYAKRGQGAKAVASWREAVLTYPLSYYALLALNRIREADPTAYGALITEISTDPPGFDPRGAAFAFGPQPEWGAPGFARARAFLSLGLGDPAEAELRKLGLVPPGDKKRVDDPIARDKLWAMAVLYDRAERYSTSHWPTRWHILDYRRQWPIGANRAKWKVAYPTAFWPLLTEHAAKNNLPVAMQIAIVREESAFDPLRESYANAIGLTQMIFSTGARFAKGTGIEATRDNLRDAAKNVTIGSRFLGYLFAYRKHFVMLVPPSYNAGEAGVDRMLRARGSWDTDEFIEGIVDDQARNYSKRVLSSYFTYSWLYGAEVPRTPNRIPTELLPK